MYQVDTMTLNMTIEKLSQDNFSAFVFLIKKLAEYEQLPPPTREAEVRLRRDGLSEQPKYEACLGKLNGTYVAYAIFIPAYSSFLARPTLYLEDIFVLGEHRRKGLGGELFAFCVRTAREKGCGRVEWCVLDWNTPAIEFYKKMGGRQLDWRFFRLTEEDMESF